MLMGMWSAPPPPPPCGVLAEYPPALHLALSRATALSFRGFGENQDPYSWCALPRASPGASVGISWGVASSEVPGLLYI